MQGTGLVAAESADQTCDRTCCQKIGGSTTRDVARSSQQLLASRVCGHVASPAVEPQVVGWERDGAAVEDERLKRVVSHKLDLDLPHRHVQSLCGEPAHLGCDLVHVPHPAARSDIDLFEDSVDNVREWSGKRYVAIV